MCKCFSESMIVQYEVNKSLELKVNLGFYLSDVRQTPLSDVSQTPQKLWTNFWLIIILALSDHTRDAAKIFQPLNSYNPYSIPTPWSRFSDLVNTKNDKILISIHKGILQDVKKQLFSTDDIFCTRSCFSNCDYNSLKAATVTAWLLFLLMKFSRTFVSGAKFACNCNKVSWRKKQQRRM